MAMTYRETVNLKNEDKIGEIKRFLPPFVDDFDAAMDGEGLSTRTRKEYMYDLRLFFDYMFGKGGPHEKPFKDIRVTDLERISQKEIERYLLSFKYSRRAKDTEENAAVRLKARKLSTLRSMYAYFYSHGDISVNPAAQVKNPKIPEKEVVVLTREEIKGILRSIETGAGLTERQAKFAEKTRLRDRAIFCTLLGTGIRISELVGLDIDDVDFFEGALHIVRKGGDEDVSFFPIEVETALRSYIENEREYLNPNSDALFVAVGSERLTDRAIENMIKKYAEASGIRHKNVKVHMLRASYATNLYNETQDVYLLKDALHHKSLETSRRYVGGAYDRRRAAAKASRTLFGVE